MYGFGLGLCAMLETHAQRFTTVVRDRSLRASLVVTLTRWVNAHL